MAQSPLTENSYLPTCSILSNGSEIQGVYYNQLVNLRITQEINRISEAELVFRDGDASTQQFTITDSTSFIPGSKITIQLGYESLNTTVFIGLVVKVSVSTDDIDGPRLKVLCKDEALKMTVTRKNAIFQNSTDSEVVTQIIGSWGLSSKIESTSVTNKELVQYYASDWDFVITRAEVNGMIIFTNNGILTMAKPVVSSTADLMVTYGTDLISFDCEMDSTTQLSGVSGNAWDPASQMLISAEAKSPTVNTQGNLSSDKLASVLDAGTSNINSGATVEQAAIQQWADATLLKSSLSKFKGTVTFQGSSLAQTNATLSLNGLGSRFNGNAYITGIVHTFDSDGWLTEATIGMPDEWHYENPYNSGPIASGLLPGVLGLQVGLVRKIDQDPDNQFRIQVEIPILGTSGKTVWARIASFYAGNSIGAYFMPEINDEVVLGFMNDDPRYPIIIGSLYSSSIPMPETPDSTNSIKTIITSSKMQVKFDETNKIISILTPGGNSIVLSDENSSILLTDMQSNTIKMDSSGITLNSNSDITLNATNQISISGLNISIDAKTSLSESGMNVSISGDTSTSISGSAECSVSSTGQMTINGAMVMIN